jgi:hypothetical protein
MGGEIGRGQDWNPFRFVARGGHLKHALVVRTRRGKVKPRTLSPDQRFLLAVMGELNVIGDSRYSWRLYPKVSDGDGRSTE